MTDKQTVDLKIQLELDEADQEELDRITRDLRAEIEDLDVDSVKPVKGGPAPAGTKVVDWAQIGQLAVTLAPTIVPHLFELLKRRSARKPNTPLKLKVMVGDRALEAEYDPATISPEQVRQLTESLTKALGKK
ncbi:MAG: hypothetical protein ONA90_09915 [candidate division KSB1 bacterium]|nr:hypothetical protein [candidate division KSB1 bacterium]